MRALDLSGRRFGRWTALRRWPYSLGWVCRCSCRSKTVRIVLTTNLTGGKSRSCGCLKETNPAHITHGLSKTSPEYVVWKGMRARCSNPRHKSYKDYGARGITVCKRWNSFENFLKDMGQRPSPAYTIDRKKNHLGYSKSNCRWATRLEQRHNRREAAWLYVMSKAT